MLAHHFKLWFKSSRPYSWTATFVPVALGAALAAHAGRLNWFLLALTLIGSLLVQVGCNTTNDYFDHLSGADKEGSPNPSEAIQTGLATPAQVYWYGKISFVLAGLIGLFLATQSGPLALVFAILAIIAAFVYTGGPFPLAYNRLGEVLVFIFMGPVIVAGTFYVQHSEIPTNIILASLPVGFLVAAIMHANNIRDIETDPLVGKFTMANLVGRTWAIRQFVGLFLGAYLGVVALVVTGYLPWPALLALISVPVAKKLIDRTRMYTDINNLNLVLRDTAILHTQAGALMVVGVVVGLWV